MDFATGFVVGLLSIYCSKTLIIYCIKKWEGR